MAVIIGKLIDDVVSGYIGTEGYMAPEVCVNEHSDTPYSATKADLWAAGATVESLLRHSVDPGSSLLRPLAVGAEGLTKVDPSARLSLDEALGLLRSSRQPLEATDGIDRLGSAFTTS